MPYYQTYNCKAFNRLGQLIDIEFWSTTFSDTIYQLPLVSFHHEYINGENDKFDPCIIGSRAIIKVRAWPTSPSHVHNEMFYANAYDEWKVICKIDTVVVFTGFVSMDVEPYILKDKPYDVVVSCTDGLGLLKNEELTDINGDQFEGRNTFLEYILGALKKTNLDLNLRVCVNIYNVANDDRLDSGSPDMFTQNCLHHKTFEKDVNVFYDCYESLERILGGWCILYQYMGLWVIGSRSDLQYLSTNYHSEYDSDGADQGTVFDVNGMQVIGKNQNIHATNLDQNVSYAGALKGVTTRFKYRIPPNLVNNQRLQNLGDLIAPLSGVGYSAYELVGWTHYQGQPQPLADQVPAASNAYIKVEVDTYGTQTDRYYVIEHDATAPSTTLENYIRNDNDDCFLDEGDELTIGLTYRSTLDHNATVGCVALLRDGFSGNSAGDWRSLDEDGVWHSGPYATFARHDAGEDATEWKTTTVDRARIPENGVLYLFLGAGDISDPQETHFKDILVDVTLYVRGSRLDVDGDYWKTEQDANIKDKIDEEIFISDAPKRIITGAIWNEAGTALTDPDWYQQFVTENRHFKEIVNLVRFRHQRTRRKRIEGQFKGVMCMPAGNPTIQLPLGFHRQFQMENQDLNFVLVPPLQIDYVQGFWRGTLMSGYETGDTVEDGDTHVFNYEFK